MTFAQDVKSSIPTRQDIVDFLKTDQWRKPHQRAPTSTSSTTEYTDADGLKHPAVQCEVPPCWHFKARFLRMKSHFRLSEFSGALGDIGTLVPILITMSQKGQTSLGASLFFAGAYNILTGFYYGIPMCVQPMKSIASIAMANDFTPGEVAGAGIIMSAIVFGLGITRLIWLVSRFIPLPVVRGLQLGAAIQLCKTAVTNIKKGHATAFWGDGIKWNDNALWIIASFLFVIVFYQRRKVPTAMIIFVAGLAIALVMTGVSHDYGQVVAGGPTFHIVVPSHQEFVDGFLQAGLGQLPLTLLNSVIALAALVYDLYPGYDLSISNIAMTVGSMNLVGCFFGSMPFCHGSGGLAGQYFFGARTELSLYALGLCKVVLALIFGDSLLGIVKHFPQSILAVMLFIASVELGVNARNFTLHKNNPYRLREDFVVLVATAASLSAFSNDGLGFITGMAIALVFWIRRRYWFGENGDGVRKGSSPSTTVEGSSLNVDSGVAKDIHVDSGNDDDGDGGDSNSRKGHDGFIPKGPSIYNVPAPSTHSKQYYYSAEDNNVNGGGTTGRRGSYNTFDNQNPGNSSAHGDANPAAAVSHSNNLLFTRRGGSSNSNGQDGLDQLATSPNSEDRRRQKIAENALSNCC
ncbi:hypothetical protein H4219_006201 [Mycoemilia scoparia]|uniref:Sulfate transporter n=1 Tax=Mycoemilia scoparia TaxID=417184 RepID=A0A9W8DJD9_9FUNG|nr:hypothetical protein H4219_006201 [Mycoemilia scoparia]